MENNALIENLAKAKGEFGEIVKSKTVTVKGQTKTGKDYQYDFNYAELNQILEATTPALSKHGVFISQTIVSDETGFTCLTKIQGHGGLITSEYPIFFKAHEKSTHQDFAAAVSYVRRHAYNLAVGISADDDNDGNDALDLDFKVKPKVLSQKPQNPVPMKTQEPVKQPVHNYAPNSNGVSQAQIKRLFTLANLAAWSTDLVKQFIQGFYKINSTSELTKNQYDELCNFLEDKCSFSEASQEMTMRYGK